MSGEPELVDVEVHCRVCRAWFTKPVPTSEFTDGTRQTCPEGHPVNTLVLQAAGNEAVVEALEVCQSPDELAPGVQESLFEADQRYATRVYFGLGVADLIKTGQASIRTAASSASSAASTSVPRPKKSK